MTNYSTLGHNLKRGVFTFCAKLSNGRYRSEPTKDHAEIGLFFAFLSLKGASCAYSRRSASLLRATE